MSGDAIQGGPHRRAGSTRIFWGTLFLCGVVGSGLLLRTVWFSTDAAATPVSAPLIVHVAAALRTPLEVIAADYTKETGNKIEVRLGPSQTLLANIELGRQGDVFIPADDSYIELAKNKKLTAEVIPAAEQWVRVAVQKGNPKNIRTFDDLLRPEIRLVQANPGSAAIGKIVRDHLQKANLWEPLAKKTAAFKPAVTEVANDVKISAADASLAWDTMNVNYPDLEFLSIAPLDTLSAKVSVAVLNTTQDATAALKFARYVTASDRGLLQFGIAGFKVVPGDKWSAFPEIDVLAGAMVRPAIEQTIVAFEAREGVRVNRVYNGCGILVSQMRGGQHPDAFIACDAAFMKQVSGFFGPSTTLSRNSLVIAVKKGNPHRIMSMRDLGKEGLRLGVGHEQQCALGAVTKETFLTGGVYAKVARNIVVQVPAGDMLINQMRAGSLDAAVVYVSNMKLADGELDAVPISGFPCSVVEQPVAVGRKSDHPQLTGRLISRLLAAESQTAFRDWGFEWVGAGKQTQ
jgi:molybdate transport system substrate-binding protein